MGLSNAQLLMLDTLIYANCCDNGITVKDVVGAIEEKLSTGENPASNPGEKEGLISNDDWRGLVKMIKNEPELLQYKITNYEPKMRAACFVDDENNPTDVNVVFRGTVEDYEWHDNGQGGYLPYTEHQEAAALYVNNLPDEYGNNLTVTGHSKGGNKAQYVTIVTDRIGRCVSYDGQGFSNEFLNEYKAAIRQKANKITSISANDDYVNCLLNPIAGTRIYVDSKWKFNPLQNHNPFNLLDSDGTLRRETDQGPMAKFITDYTTYMISNVDEPMRSYVVDGMLGMLEKGGEKKEDKIQNFIAIGYALGLVDDYNRHVAYEAGKKAKEIFEDGVEAVKDFTSDRIDDMINAWNAAGKAVKNTWNNGKDAINGLISSFTDDYDSLGSPAKDKKDSGYDKEKEVRAEYVHLKKSIRGVEQHSGYDIEKAVRAEYVDLKKRVSGLKYDLIAEKYGIPEQEYIVTLATVATPYLFLDELQEVGKGMTATVPVRMMNFVEVLSRKMETYGKKTAEYGKKFVEAMSVFVNKLTVSKSGVASSRSGYVAADGGILIDTQSMRNYVTRLRRLSNTIMTTRSNIISLAADSRNPGLSQVAYMEAMQNYSRWLNNTADYLTQTAADFENIEREIKGQI